MSVARVVSLHRYPVKSMLGEQVAALDVEGRGVVGDRRWSVRPANGKIGSGKSTRRFAAVPGLLMLRAQMAGDHVEILPPTGEAWRADDPATASALSLQLGQPVTLAEETDVSHFDDGPVSLIGLASIAAIGAEAGHDIDPSRFRANLVIDGVRAYAEDGWIGRRIDVGGATLEVTMRSVRCVMVDMETADLPAQSGNLLATSRANEMCVGVIARVVRLGRITVGDALEVVVT